MSTFAGTQAQLPDLLRALVELELDAIAACDSAVARLGNGVARHELQRFRADHEEHVRALSEVMVEVGEKPPSSADAKALLAQGKVIIGKLVGDGGVLRAMRSNEHDTNLAYERATQRDDLSDELHALMRHCLDDERRHRRWIEEHLALLPDAEGEPEPTPEPASEEFLGSRWG